MPFQGDEYLVIEPMNSKYENYLQDSNIPSSQVDNICKIHTMHIFQKNKLETRQINIPIQSVENPYCNTLQYTIYSKYGVY